MKTTLVLAIVLICTLPSICNADGPHLYAPDGTYLGDMNNDPTDPNSINNPTGKYGSPVSPYSIHNPTDLYGSPVSPQSPNRPGIQGAPRIPRVPGPGW